MDTSINRLNLNVVTSSSAYLSARVDPDLLVRAVDAVNKAELAGERSELTITLDNESRRPVVRLVDRETREVIRQIPDEYVLRMARNAIRKQSSSL